MKNTIEKRFMELYKKAEKEFSKLVDKKATHEEITEAIKDRDSISELYVKIVKGKTYLSSESNILKKVNPHDFCQIEETFISKCEQEIEQEKGETNE